MLKIHLFMYLFIHLLCVFLMRWGISACHNTYIEDRGQFMRVDSLLLHVASRDQAQIFSIYF